MPHPEAVRILTGHYGDRATARRMSMAELPEGAELVLNPLSGAPGCRIGNVWVLPGVPELVERMFPQVAAHMAPGSLVERAFTAGLPESEFADLMDEALSAFPAVEVGSYPHLADGTWTNTLVVKGAVEADVTAAEQWLRERLAPRIAARARS